MVKPLLRVVLSVFEPWLTGVARPRKRDSEPFLMALMAVRLRVACCRFNASRREAIVEAIVGDGDIGGDGGERVDGSGSCRWLLLLV
jgi:hypothetical protein